MYTIPPIIMSRMVTHAKEQWNLDMNYSHSKVNEATSTMVHVFTVKVDKLSIHGEFTCNWAGRVLSARQYEIRNLKRAEAKEKV